MFEACFMKTHYYSATNCVTTEYHRGSQPQASTWTNSHQFSPSVKAFPLPSSDIRWKQGIKTPQSRKTQTRSGLNDHPEKEQTLTVISEICQLLPIISHFPVSAAPSPQQEALHVWLGSFIVLCWWGLVCSAGIEPVTPAVKLRSPTDKCHSSNKLVQLSKWN